MNRPLSCSLLSFVQKSVRIYARLESDNATRLKGRPFGRPVALVHRPFCSPTIEGPMANVSEGKKEEKGVGRRSESTELGSVQLDSMCSLTLLFLVLYLFFPTPCLSQGGILTQEESYFQLDFHCGRVVCPGRRYALDDTALRRALRSALSPDPLLLLLLLLLLYSQFGKAQLPSPLRFRSSTLTL